jgi:integrase
VGEYPNGLPVGEALMLTVDDVNFKNHRIRIRRLKNGLGGEKPLWAAHSQTAAQLSPRATGCGPLSVHRPQGALQRRQVQKLFTDYAREAGIQARSVHALRHSMAVYLLEAGRNIGYVADHLGHKNIQNTRIYARITNPLREQVFRELEGHPKIVRIT